MAVAPSSNTSSSRFLDLPPELRNRIYRLTVIEDKPIEIIHDKKQRKAERPTHPALADTYEQIQNEVLSIFYGENSFVYSTSGDIVQQCDAVVESWIDACRPWLPFIKSVGVSDHFKYAASNYNQTGIIRSAECYLTVSLGAAEESVTVWLGGDLEDQCMCPLNERDWSNILNCSRKKFIKDTMRDCRRDLKNRIYRSLSDCEICGNPYGMGERDGLQVMVPVVEAATLETQTARGKRLANRTLKREGDSPLVMGATQQ